MSEEVSYKLIEPNVVKILKIQSQVKKKIKFNSRIKNSGI